MATIYKVDCPNRKPLFEGVQGENEARSIQFDITPWVEELGSGAVTATAKRPQDSQPYPVTVTKDGNIVTWKPTSTDTAYEGVGSFQLEYTVGGVIAKTCIWSTQIAPSLDPAGDPPDPYDNWLADMRQVAADALQSAQDAEQSAQDAADEVGNAQAEVYEAEAWANGTKNGTPVASTDEQYENNAKYYSEESYKNSEAWAVGQRGGVDVPSTDPAYENNAKYWAEQSLANQYSAYIVKSASGDIASFSDGADNIPMKSLKVAIIPKQAGSGDPSPTNVRPITGASTANVMVTNDNLLTLETWDGFPYNAAAGTVLTPTRSSKVLTDNGDGSFSITFASTWQNVALMQDVSFGGTFRLKATVDSTATLGISGYLLDENFKVLQTVIGNNVPSNYNWLIDLSTHPETKYIAIAFTNRGSTNTTLTITEPQLLRGTGTPVYQPPIGHTTPVPLGQTVYGGEVDVATGVLTLTHGMKYYDGTATPYDVTTNFGTGYNRATYLNTQSEAKRGTAYAIMSDKFAYSNSYYLGLYKAHINENGILLLGIPDTITSVAQMKTWAGQNPFTVVYELATPTTVQLTPAEVRTLLGDNNVWSDAGAVEVEYRADPTLAYNELANVIVSLGGNI